MKIAVVKIRIVKIAEEKFPELKIGRTDAATTMPRSAHTILAAYYAGSVSDIRYADAARPGHPLPAARLCA
jgi:hypothetical protein